MSAPLLAGADGGGSGLRLRLCEDDGRVLAEAQAGRASLTHGPREARENLLRALAQAKAQAGVAPDAPTRLCLALAGSRSAANRAAFLEGPALGAETILLSDGYAALLGALGGAAGSVIAVGTGVIARRRRRDGSLAESSGWGFPVGDEGGGAWIGLRAAGAYTRFLDGRAPTPFPLFEALAREIGDDVATAQNWLLAADATAFARLAPLVVAAGDTVAAAILDDAGAALAQALDGLERDGPCADPVALCGGLAAALAPHLPAAMRARLVAPRGDVIDGALMVLRGEAETETLTG